MSTKKKKKPAAKKAVKKAANKPAKKTAKKVVAKKTTKKAAKQPVKKPAKKVVASKAAKKTAKKIAAKKPTKKVAAKKVTKKVVAKAPKPVVKKVVSKALKKAAKPAAPKAPKKVVKKVTAPPPVAAVTSAPTLIHTESTTPSTSPITIHGVLAIDTDGTGPSHNDADQQNETSAKLDANGKFVPKSDPSGVRFLNADVDEYSVAPKNLATVNGGPLSVGDLATVVLPNGTTRSIPIGDFGPNNKAGEFSLAAVQALGVQVLFTHIGPIPTLDGPAASNIPVTVTFHPGSAS